MIRVLTVTLSEKDWNIILEALDDIKSSRNMRVADEIESQLGWVIKEDEDEDD